MELYVTAVMPPQNLQDNWRKNLLSLQLRTSLQSFLVVYLQSSVAAVVPQGDVDLDVDAVECTVA